MKAKTKFSVVIVLIAVIVISLIGYLFYTPPLLDRGGYNIPGRIYDLFAYIYYRTKADWLDSGEDNPELRRASALAAWYRPDRIEELLGIPSDDLFRLGREYAVRGLPRESVRIFRVIISSASSDRDQSLKIISFLSGLGDWPGVTTLAGKLYGLYPESAEVNYWLGRAFLERGESQKALGFLARAGQYNPALADVFYQAGRAEEERGRRDAALSQYEKTVTILPGHRGAWNALRRLYQEKGKMKKRERAVSRLKELTPAVPLKIVRGERFILSGYSFSQPELTTGQNLIVDIYIEGAGLSLGKVQPELSLSSSSHPERISWKGKMIPIPLMGEVVKVVISGKIPPVLYPGSVQIEISIYDPETGEKLEIGGTRYIYLTSFDLSPGWTPSASRKELIKSHFGPGARSLGKGTFLGPGTEIMIGLNGEEKMSGMGLISYGHTSNFLLQGSMLGEIVVDSDCAEELVLPIKVGAQTAEVWWEGTLPWQRAHRLAAIYRSWPVNFRGKRFKAHEYYAVYLFPHPRIIKDIHIRNLSIKSGLYIRDLILIPLPMSVTQPR